MIQKVQIYLKTYSNEKIIGAKKPETPIMCLDDPKAVINAWWGFTETLERKEQILLCTNEEDLNESFYMPYRKNKCLVLVNGFYIHDGHTKVNYLYHKADKKIFMLAGVYRDIYNNKTNEMNRQYVVLLRRAKGVIKDNGDNHSKMPIALFSKKQWTDFLESGQSASDIDFRFTKIRK